ncbi:ABC transporter permease [Trebonia kvetii]|uniref:ABC transporter permease n=1 Tax=Trebonia kvetii TaxID=2480626 RepID=UPI0016524CC6|nr:ABC transporter permease [Trebonia kvetii]
MPQPFGGKYVIGFLVRRILQAAVVVLIVTVITFILLRAIPGNVAVAILGPSAYRNPATLAQFNAQYGFDKPWFQQYLLWLGHLLQGNLGFSWTLDQPVASLLGQRLPKTIALVGISTLLALVIAVPIGLWQAVRRNKATDYTFTGLSFLFYAAPTFFVGTVLILVFSVHLGWFGPEAPQGGLWSDVSDWHDLTLPVITLALVTIALFSRYMRSAVLDNLTEDYVRTARAKGASQRRVLWRHVMRNSLIPIATLLGLSLPAIISGALITESVFNYPGMGYLFYQSAQKQDYPVMLGFIVVVAIATVIGSLLADIAYAVLDPRVRYA